MPESIYIFLLLVIGNPTLSFVILQVWVSCSCWSY